jgi:DNA-binding transcriptional LysR family regulator
MEMSHIRHFLALADAGSVGRAAQSIGVSQPALSKSIRRLEGELHVRLFDRTPRGSPLTRYGKTFLQHARAISLATHNAETSIRAMRGAGPDDLCIGVSPSLARTVLPLASAALVKENPGLRVHVVTGMVDELLARVSAGTIEFAVMASPEQPSPEGLEQEVLINTELEVVARKGHPLSRHPRPSLGDLLAYPWILPSGAASGRQALYRSFSALGLPLPVPTIESDSITYISSFLQDNDYLSFLPLSLVGAHDGMQELSPLRIEDHHWLRPLAATYRKGMLLSKSSRQLVAHIQREVVKLESYTWALRAQARSGAAAS